MASKIRMLQGIQMLRAIAALLVVVHHVLGLERKLGLLEGSWLEDRRWIDSGAFGVDLLFVISGFVLVYSWGSQAGGLRTAREFLARRAFRILPLYWIATIAALALNFAVAWSNGQGVPEGGAGSPSFLARSLLLVPPLTSAGRPEPLVGAGWVLSYEMAFHLVFALGLLLHRIGPFVLAGAVLALLPLLASIVGDGPWAELLGKRLYWEILLGMLIGWGARRGWIPPRPWAMTALLASILAMAAATVAGIAESPQWIFQGLPAAVALELRRSTQEERVQEEQVGNIGPRAFPCWLSRLGDASYALFLMHPLVVNGPAAFVLARLPGHPWMILPGLVATTGLSVLSALVVHDRVEPLLRRLFRPEPSTISQGESDAEVRDPAREARLRARAVSVR